MTKFMGLTSNLMSEKWRMMNWIIIIDLIFLVAVDVLRIFTGGWDGQIFPDYFFATFMISLSFANFVGFILLARKNERVYTSNNYRLLPVSETKLYFSNLLTTFLGLMYLQVLEVVLGTIFYFISGQSDFNLAAGEIKGSVGTAALMWLLMTLTMILIWMGITSVHFLINWISGFLPFSRQKFVNFILYIVVTVVGMMIFNYTSGNVFRVIYNGSQGITTLGQVNNVIWLGIGIVVIWGVIFSAINIYLLKRWTETDR
ncbi:hypothetical protein [Companilactobacillus heilongjiangensis]|uniref:Uncharacterized protein n=1 Tax=Companilactobacillus heilongjiangensis TaxID=1074467 RepID=A0A0K2LF51_9LACO|nr:hypothetical protein [Companilactobacillus heilongjiangensis]ALB29922.1 hypothetical protein JP39_11455 [Companilactobacillus heilongjiangensis]